MVNKWSGELYSLTRCFPFQCLATFNPKIRPLLDGAESNKNRWCELEKERQARQKEEEENKHQPITWHCWRTSFFYSSYSLPYRQMVGINRNSIRIQSEFNRLIFKSCQLLQGVVGNSPLIDPVASYSHFFFCKMSDFKSFSISSHFEDLVTSRNYYYCYY